MPLDPALNGLAAMHPQPVQNQEGLGRTIMNQATQKQDQGGCRQGVLVEHETHQAWVRGRKD